MNGYISKIFKFLSSLTKSEENAEDFIETSETKAPIPQHNLGIKAMIVTDSHGKLMQRDIDSVLDENGLPEVVFLLGDNRASDIDVLQHNERLKGIKFYGVVGNHEGISTLKECGIPDLHLNTVRVGNYIVGGFGGALKYKESNSMMWTQEECSELLSTMERCDILLTHNKPEFELPEVVTSHTGFIGLGDYIKRCKPKYALHGHLHDLYDTHYDSTIIKCLYGVSIINL